MNKLRLILYKLGWLKKRRIHKSYVYLDNFRYSYPFGRSLLKQEQQIYLDKNVIERKNSYDFLIKREHVRIKPQYNLPKDNFKYTSGMLYSKRQFLYGSFEADICIPKGYGLWSAFWLQGQSDEGIREIDIFEYYGKNNIFAYTIHYGESYKNKKMENGYTKIPSLENNWYRYRLDWGKKKLKFYIDDCLVGVLNGDSFNIPMNLIINCAVEKDVEDKLDKDLPTIMGVKNIKYYDIK